MKVYILPNVLLPEEEDIASFRSWHDVVLVRALRFVFRSALFFKMATRIKCELPDLDCDNLVKVHIQSPQKEDYKEDDFEDVVAGFANFLCAAATLTSRLSQPQLAASVSKQFALPDKVCSDFAKAMTEALSYCYSKKCKATTGKKLSEPVKSVCMSFKTGNKNLQSKLQISPKVSVKRSQADANFDDCAHTGEEVDISPAAAEPKSPVRLCKEIWGVYGISPPSAVKRQAKIRSSMQAAADNIDASSSSEQENMEVPRYLQ